MSGRPQILKWATVAAGVGLVSGAGMRWIVNDSHFQQQRVHEKEEAIAASSSKHTAVTLGQDPRVERRPTLDEVLASDAQERLKLLARFLPEATLEDGLAIAESWKYRVNNENSPQMAWKLLLARLIDLDPPAAFDTAKKFGEKRSRTSFQNYVCRTWAAKDPSPALAFALLEPKKYLPQMIEVVARQDIDRAFGLVDEFPDIPSLATAVLTQLAKSDPEAALARAESMDGGASGTDMLGPILREWAQQAPEAALAYLDDLDVTETKRGSLQRSIVSAMIEKHPGEAERALANRFPPGKDRFNMFKVLASRKARDSPEGAFAWAEALPPGPERHAAIAITIKAVTESVPARVIELLDRIGWEHALPNAADGSQLREFGGGGGGSYSHNGSLIDTVRDSLKAMAKTDPVRALKYAARLPATSGGWHEPPRDDAVEEIGRQWIVDDPSGYLSWLSSSGFAELPKQLDVEIGSLPIDKVERLAEEDFPQLSGELRRKMARALAHRLLESNPGRALELIGELDESARESESVSLVQSMAENVPERGMAYFDRVATKSKPQVAATLLRSLAEQDFQQARQWFFSKPDAALGGAGYRAMTQVWFQNDPREASEWVAALPPGDNRDRSVAALADLLASDRQPDFDAAIQWAEAIDDDSLRSDGLRKVYQHLLRHDRAVGEVAIDASSLSDQHKESLLKRK